MVVDKLIEAKTHFEAELNKIKLALLGIDSALKGEVLASAESCFRTEAPKVLEAVRVDVEELVQNTKSVIANAEANLVATAERDHFEAELDNIMMELIEVVVIEQVAADKADCIKSDEVRHLNVLFGLL